MAEDRRTPGDSEPWEEDNSQTPYPELGYWHFHLREDGSEAPQPEQPSQPRFDLEERTAKFGEAIIRFAKRIPQNPVNNRIIDQLVGCGTSVGGNYCEADEAVSKKEFLNKIGTCKKEAKESKFFLRMAATAEPGSKKDARELWREAKELHLIFSAIFRKGRGK